MIIISFKTADAENEEISRDSRQLFLKFLHSTVLLWLLICFLSF